jgi:large subunit ribosomal protein L21
MATPTKTTPAAKKAPVKKAPKEVMATPKAKKVAKEGTFAVIKTGGKQYRVAVGDIITIEKFKEERVKGDTVSFNEVLLTDDGATTNIGTPFLSGVVVSGEVTVIGRAPKVIVIKYKQKSRYMKKNGHRQPFIKVKITSIA